MYAAHFGSAHRLVVCDWVDDDAGKPLQCEMTEGRIERLRDIARAADDEEASLDQVTVESEPHPPTSTTTTAAATDTETKNADDKE